VIDKLAASALDAVADVRSGSTVLVGGFGEAGQPDNLLEALVERGVTDLTMVCNNVGRHDYGLASLIARGRVRKMICTYPSYPEASAFKKRYLDGDIELELVPQGTLVERMRAAGAGLGGFFTPTGAETELARGKELREIDGVVQVLERPLKGDFALVRGMAADRWGNLTYWRAQRNFNPIVAMAGGTTIAEVDRIVPLGSLDPDAIVTPGVFVQRVTACPALIRT
jgi:3-oxoadipate CoA-transferase alpha subunit